MLNQFKTIILLALLSLILLAFGSTGGPQTLAFTFALAIALNIGAYYFSDKLVLRMHKAQIIPPSEASDLYRITQELALAAKIPMPRLYIIPSDIPNAFATGRNPRHSAVAVTQGLLRILDRPEVRGVIAHEIAHIKNRDVLLATIAAVFSSAVSYLADITQWSAIFGGRSDEHGHSPVGTIAMALIAPIGALLIQMGISRSREYLADETAAQLTGDPMSLASALGRISQVELPAPSMVSASVASLYICNQFSSRAGIMSLFSTHPPTEKRIQRLMDIARQFRLAA